MTQKNRQGIWRGIALLALLLAQSVWADCYYSDKSDVKNDLNITAYCARKHLTPF